MLVLFTCCWGSNLSIEAEVGKLNGDLLQPSRIRYEVWSFSVRYLISIAYWKVLIFRVKLSVVVPQAIGISLCNRIGNSTGDVPCFYLGVCGHNGIDIIDLLSISPCFCVAFYSMFVHWHSHLLVWPWFSFYHGTSNAYTLLIIYARIDLTRWNILCLYCLLVVKDVL